MFWYIERTCPGHIFVIKFSIGQARLLPTKVNEIQMTLVLSRSRNDIIGLPSNHYSVIAVRENDRVLAFYNEAILYDDTFIVLEGAKRVDYLKLRLAWNCYKVLSCR